MRAWTDRGRRGAGQRSSTGTPLSRRPPRTTHNLQSGPALRASGLPFLPLLPGEEAPRPPCLLPLPPASASCFPVHPSPSGTIAEVTLVTYTDHVPGHALITWLIMH